MKKNFRVALKAITVVAGIYIIISAFCYFTGVLRTFRTSSTANEPNLEQNAFMLISNLKEPKIGDFVCYNHVDPLFGKHSRIHRLCAKEGDTLQIINGKVHVNNVNTDEKINLIHFYKLPKSDYLKIKAAENLADSNQVLILDTEIINVLLEDRIAKKYHLETAREIIPSGKREDMIYNTYKTNWNKDNFGPLILPKGKLFVIGDNRDNSEDSRYIGLIDASNVVGVLLNN
ncbi:signal peptidase I [Flavobacterium pedocola]